MIPMDRLEIAHYQLECWHTQSMRQKQKGGAHEVRGGPGWERARAQIDTWAIDAVGPEVSRTGSR